jgi:hypothetical protein
MVVTKVVYLQCFDFRFVVYNSWREVTVDIDGAVEVTAYLTINMGRLI